MRSSESSFVYSSQSGSIDNANQILKDATMQFEKMNEDRKMAKMKNEENVNKNMLKVKDKTPFASSFRINIDDI